MHVHANTHMAHVYNEMTGQKHGWPVENLILKYTSPLKPFSFMSFCYLSEPHFVQCLVHLKNYMVKQDIS